jgi:pyruvate/oxaloacetate carboxyltransferase
MLTSKGARQIHTPQVAFKRLSIHTHGFFRNNWGKTTVNVYAELMRNIHNSESTTRYLSADVDERKILMKSLLATLEENEHETQEVSDYDMVQMALERHR